MSTAAPPPDQDELNDVTIARIDGLDQALIAPLRGFLESRGCTVIVNSTPRVTPVYYLIVGGERFVKTILAEKSSQRSKRLCIIQNGTAAKAETVQETYKAKVILTDRSTFSSRDCSDIFSFFFTSDAMIFDMRENTEEKEDVIEQQPVIVEKREAPRDEMPSVLDTKDRERIGKIISDVFRPEDLSSQAGEKQKTGHKRRDTKQRGSIGSLIHGFSIGFGLFLLPLFWYLASIGIGILGIGYTGRFLFSGNMTAATITQRMGLAGTQSGRIVLSLVTPVFRFLEQDHRVRDQERLLTIIGMTATSEESVLSMIGTAQALSSQLFLPIGSQATVAGASAAALAERLKNELFFVETNLGATTADLEQFLLTHSFPFSLSPVRSVGMKAMEFLTSLRKDITDIDRLLTVYLGIGGFRTKQTYLVLLQNSMELRPTGGFIGSIGLVSFVDGKFVDFQIQDVYAIDGQLKGHVDPPLPVAQLLGQEHWYLRDSNWDPDFSKSGKQAAFFYEKETGERVDGVIGISTPFITDILGVTGPMKLDDYNDTITKENFFGKSLYYTQQNFFPGSTQKKDFLGSLTTALMQKLTNPKTVNNINLFRVFTRALDRRDIQFYFSDRQMETLVSRYGWAGSVPDHVPCGSDELACLGEYIALVEANVGVNKANYFVERSGLYQIAFDGQGKLQEMLTLAYRNSSTADQQGGGPYTQYLRAILPQDAEDLKMTLDGKDLHVRTGSEKGTLPVPYAELLPDQGDLRIVGVALTVPVDSDKRLVFSYTRKKQLAFDQHRASYRLLVQKQPGIGDMEMHTIITYPIDWTVTQEEGMVSGRIRLAVGRQSLLANEGKLEYNESLVSDRVIRLRFSQ